MSEKKKSVFETLNAVNVNDKTEKRGRFTYLSWAWAWGEVKKAYPEADFIIYENADGWCYHTDGRTAWVKTGVIIDGIEHIEYLPIIDPSNNSIPLDKITSFDVNKSIQRSLTKAVARHGLGLYIYAGEDLPETERENVQAQDAKLHDAPKAPAAGKPKEDKATDVELKTFKDYAATLGVDYAEIWRETGDPNDLSKKHMAAANARLVEIAKNNG